MSWAKEKIGQVATVVTKGTTPTTYGMPFTESGVNFVKAEALNGDCTLDRAGFTCVAESTHEKLGRSILEEGDVLLTIAGAQVGRCGIVREEHLPANTNQAVGIIRLDREQANPKFVYYHFKNPRTFQMCQGIGGQAAQPNINLTVLKGFELPLPEVRTQEAVVEILSAYDDLIENNRRRIALLEQAARMLYREWFIHLRFPGHEHAKITNGLPEGWERQKLVDVVDLVKDNVLPANFAEDEIHIGLEHIPRRSFTLADWEPAKDLASGKTRFAEGDILFCKIRPYFHKVGFALRSGLASSDAIVWRVKDPSDWPMVVCATSSDHFVAVASKTVKEGSKMPRADLKVLHGYALLKPPEGLLGIFNDTVLPITQQCKALALANRALAEARDLLLPRLMNGEIAV